MIPLTSRLYINALRSLRAFFFSIDNSIRWYLDESAENATEDEYIEVITSLGGREDERKPYQYNFAQVLVCSKEDVEVLASKIMGAIDVETGIRDIQILDYETEGTPHIGDIQIQRIEHRNIPAVAGYKLVAITIYYEMIDKEE